MKKIYLLRHAKSSWEETHLQDYERPLALRGKKSAPLMAQVLGSLETPPDLMIYSTATRAEQTMQLVKNTLKKEFSLEPRCKPEESLYESTSETILSMIKAQDNQFHALMLIGHNPTFEELGSFLLTGQYQLGLRMPTAALLGIEFMTEQWMNLRPGSGMLRELVYPKLIKALLDKQE